MKHETRINSLLSVKLIEFLAIYISQAQTFVRAHETPLLIIFNPSHELIWNPETVEQVTCTRFLLSGIFTQVQEVEDVRVPGF